MWTAGHWTPTTALPHLQCVTRTHHITSCYNGVVDNVKRYDDGCWVLGSPLISGARVKAADIVSVVNCPGLLCSRSSRDREAQAFKRLQHQIPGNRYTSHYTAGVKCKE